MVYSIVGRCCSNFHKVGGAYYIKCIDTFSNFFSDDFINLIVTESNRYAKANGNDNWETNDNEIRAYIGFTILMGIVKMPRLYNYWSTNPTYHYFPIANKISRNRFMEIKRYFHFVNNEELPKRGEMIN